MLFKRFYISTLFLLVRTTSASLNFYGPCENEPCVSEYQATCSDLIKNYDFGDCCALSESPTGCTLTAQTGCVYQTREFFCDTGNYLDAGCGANHIYFYQDDNGQYKYEGDPLLGCPLSEFPLPGLSQHEIIYPLKVTHYGIPDANFAPWDSVISSHIQGYFETHSELGVQDLLATTTLFRGDFSPQADQEEDSVTVYFLQFLSWRGEETNASFILDQAFNTEDGKQLYVAQFTSLAPNMTISELEMATPDEQTIYPTSAETSDPFYRVTYVSQDACMDGFVEATVLDSSTGNPVVGVDVGFLLVGVNSMGGGGATDENGKVTFFFTADEEDSGSDLWCSIAVDNPNLPMAQQVPCSIRVCDNPGDTSAPAPAPTATLQRQRKDAGPAKCGSLASNNDRGGAATDAKDCTSRAGGVGGARRKRKLKGSS